MNHNILYIRLFLLLWFFEIEVIINYVLTTASLSKLKMWSVKIFLAPNTHTASNINDRIWEKTYTVERILLMMDSKKFRALLKSHNTTFGAAYAAVAIAFFFQYLMSCESIYNHWNVFFSWLYEEVV